MKPRELNKIYVGDCKILLSDKKLFPNKSIDLIITSPPYAEKRKKSYGGTHPDKYVQWFLPISKELFRVLKDDGSFILNIKEHPKNGSITGDVVFIAESYVDNILELLEAGFSCTYGDFSNKLYNVKTLKGYLDYIYNISGKYFPENSRFFIFPECHDFIRNTKKLLGQLSSDQILSERANKSRWVITAMLPGIPMIFNGFEKLEWQPINLFSYSSIDWESDKDLRNFIVAVNGIRNKHKALQKGKYHYVPTSQGIAENSQLFSFVRVFGNEKILVCVNMDIHNRTECKIYLDENLGIDFSRKYALKDLLHKKQYLRDGKEVTIILEPGESHIFRVEQK